MTSDRVLWNKSHVKPNLNKFQEEVGIVKEEELAGYQNVATSAPGRYQCDYELEKNSMVIDGSQILNLT